MVALHSCQIQLKSPKPGNPSYPTELNTLGDHLRKARLDRGLSQLDVAKILNVTDDSITGWELNRNHPTAKFAKAIISFLGYVPFSESEHSLGEKLHFARLVSGKTQKEVAAEIGCDASNLRVIELGERVPQEETRKKIEAYIEESFKSLAPS